MLLVREGPDTTTLSEELPFEPFDLLVDDAHRREDLPAILSTVLDRNEMGTLVLATRPHRLAVLHSRLVDAGLVGNAVRELDALTELPQSCAESLAQHELHPKDRHLAVRLGELTRDVPALLVLAARLLSSGDLDPSTLVADETLRRDIMSRFRDERLGRLDDTVSPEVAAGLIALVAAVQPIDGTASAMISWLATQLQQDESTVNNALLALRQADLLAGSKHRQRVVPDVFADYLLHEQCVDADGQTKGRADELLAAVPSELLGRLMANLAELDWQLGRAGETRILDGVCATLTRGLVAADAWQRERLLEPLYESAAYLAPWIIRLARELLDHPATDAPLFADAVVTDTDARRALVRLLSQAGRDPTWTQAAIRLLWEIGADLKPQTSRAGGDPVGEARRLGEYQRPLHYSRALLTIVESLLADPAHADTHLHSPLSLLAGLVRREGTASELESPRRISLGSYVVDADAASDLRSQLRTLLVEQALRGGDRTRVAAAGLLGSMLAQPHGYYGRAVSTEALMQWRPEQLALLADIDAVLTSSEDPLVCWVLRDAISWHGKHSALRGVKTAVRRLQRAHPPSVDEQIIDAVTHSLARLPLRGILQRRRLKLIAQLRTDADSPGAVLDRLDTALTRLWSCRPESQADVGPLLAGLAEHDPDWAISACQMLIAEPQRATAAGVGVLLTSLIDDRPAEIRRLVDDLAGSNDPILRRLAADHISRMAWLGDRTAPERRLVVRLAADDDPSVVGYSVLAAQRCSEADPQLAADILMALRDLAVPQIAENACMVLSHELPLDAGQWQILLDRLLACPAVNYWYDAALAKRAKVAWRQVLDHLLSRLDARPDDLNYRAMPFDGLSGDLLDGHDGQRRAVLEELVASLAVDRSGSRTLDVPLLFWSIAVDRDDAFGVIGEALAEPEPTRTAAELILTQCRREYLLDRRGWVDAQLAVSPPGEPLDDLKEALVAAITSGIRQGTPGEAFPEDVSLAQTSREQAQANAAGSRPSDFWLRLAEITEAEIRQQLRTDEDDL